MPSITKHQKKVLISRIKAIVAATNLSQAESLLHCSRRSIKRLISGEGAARILDDADLHARCEKVFNGLGKAATSAPKKRSAKSPAKPKKIAAEQDKLEEGAGKVLRFVEETSVAPVREVGKQPDLPAGFMLEENAENEESDLQKIEHMCMAQDRVIRKSTDLTAVLLRMADGELVSRQARDAAQIGLEEATASLLDIVQSVAQGETTRKETASDVQVSAHNISVATLLSTVDTLKAENHRLTHKGAMGLTPQTLLAVLDEDPIVQGTIQFQLQDDQEDQGDHRTLDILLSSRTPYVVDSAISITLTPDMTVEHFRACYRSHVDAFKEVLIKMIAHNTSDEECLFQAGQNGLTLVYDFAPRFLSALRQIERDELRAITTVIDASVGFYPVGKIHDMLRSAGMSKVGGSYLFLTQAGKQFHRNCGLVRKLAGDNHADRLIRIDAFIQRAAEAFEEGKHI